MLLWILLTIISCKSIKTSSSILFNGEDLSGWTIHGSEKWYVENGLLTCENDKDENFGYLATNKKYQNFELNLEFKPNIKSNGGVFIHSKLDGTKISGLQVEIGIPGHHTAGIHSYDKGWLIKPDPINDEVLKMGKWNHMKIKVKDSKMIVWLNGTKMVSLVDSKIKNEEGNIALQIHKGTINKLQWRNIKILEL